MKPPRTMTRAQFEQEYRHRRQLARQTHYLWPQQELVEMAAGRVIPNCRAWFLNAVAHQRRLGLPVRTAEFSAACRSLPRPDLP